MQRFGLPASIFIASAASIDAITPTAAFNTPAVSQVLPRRARQR